MITHWESEGNILLCRARASESNAVPSEVKGRVCKDLSPGSATAISSGTRETAASVRISGVTIRGEREQAKCASLCRRAFPQYLSESTHH